MSGFNGCADCLPERSPPIADQRLHAARQVFLNSRPKSWNVVPMNCQCGLDYHIQIREPSAAAGASFYVNLVALEKTSRTANELTVSLETKRLKHYCAHLKKPLYLIVVEPDKNNVFWLDTQEYVKKITMYATEERMIITVPLSNKLNAAVDKLENSVINSIKKLYLQLFHRKFNRLAAIINGLNTAQQDAADNLRRQRIEDYSTVPALQSEADSIIRTGLNYIKNLDLYNPVENRRAYNHISYTLDYVGDWATPLVRSQAVGEKIYANYLYHLVNSFNADNNSSIDLLQNSDRQQYLAEVDKLNKAIITALEKGEILAGSVLMLRLSDFYYAAFPYVNKIIEINAAMELLENAEKIIEMAHELATAVESPNRELH